MSTTQEVKTFIQGWREYDEALGMEPAESFTAIWCTLPGEKAHKDAIGRAAIDALGGGAAIKQAFRDGELRDLMDRTLIALAPEQRAQ